MWRVSNEFHVKSSVVISYVHFFPTFFCSISRLLSFYMSATRVWPCWPQTFYFRKLNWPENLHDRHEKKRWNVGKKCVIPIGDLCARRTRPPPPLCNVYKPFSSHSADCSTLHLLWGCFWKDHVYQTISYRSFESNFTLHASARGMEPTIAYYCEH